MHYASINVNYRLMFEGTVTKNTQSKLGMRNCKSEEPIRNKKGLLWYKLNINTLPFYIGTSQIFSPLLLNYNSQDSWAVIG